MPEQLRCPSPEASRSVFWAMFPRVVVWIAAMGTVAVAGVVCGGRHPYRFLAMGPDIK